MTEKNDNLTDPFGFVDAINFDVIDEMDGEQLEDLLAILEKIK